MTRTASNAIPFSATFWSIRGCGWPVSLNRHPLQVQADEMLWCVKERTRRALSLPAPVALARLVDSRTP